MWMWVNNLYRIMSRHLLIKVWAQPYLIIRYALLENIHTLIIYIITIHPIQSISYFSQSKGQINSVHNVLINLHNLWIIIKLMIDNMFRMEK